MGLGLAMARWPGTSGKGDCGDTVQEKRWGGAHSQGRGRPRLLWAPPVTMCTLSQASFSKPHGWPHVLAASQQRLAPGPGLPTGLSHALPRAEAVGKGVQEEGS